MMKDFIHFIICISLLFSQTVWAMEETILRNDGDAAGMTQTSELQQAIRDLRNEIEATVNNINACLPNSQYFDVDSGTCVDNASLICARRQLLVKYTADGIERDADGNVVCTHPSEIDFASRENLEAHDYTARHVKAAIIGLGFLVGIVSFAIDTFILPGGGTLLFQIAFQAASSAASFAIDMIKVDYGKIGVSNKEFLESEDNGYTFCHMQGVHHASKAGKMRMITCQMNYIGPNSWLYFYGSSNDGLTGDSFSTTKCYADCYTE